MSLLGMQVLLTETVFLQSNTLKKPPPAHVTAAKASKRKDKGRTAR